MYRLLVFLASCQKAVFTSLHPPHCWCRPLPDSQRYDWSQLWSVPGKTFHLNTWNGVSLFFHTSGSAGALQLSSVLLVDNNRFPLPLIIVALLCVRGGPPATLSPRGIGCVPI